MSHTVDHCSALHARDDTSCSVGGLQVYKGRALDLQEQITFVDSNLKGLTLSVRAGVHIKCLVMVMGSTPGWEGGHGDGAWEQDAKREAIKAQLGGAVGHLRALL